MTKNEFTSKMPDILYHKTWGYAELEFMKFDIKEIKVGVFYRHEDKRSSYATIKGSWQDLYNDLAPYLEKEGHMEQFKKS
jgi:hypothetical protein